MTRAAEEAAQDSVARPQANGSLDRVTATRSADKPKYYVLEMFPYPSGRLHIGHVRNYAMGDVVARYRKAKRYNVLHPMGWDAFGMPAENAAMEKGVHPGDWTYQNIAAMKAQFEKLGLSLDWSEQYATIDDHCRKISQLSFLDLVEKGQVYNVESPAMWDIDFHTAVAQAEVEDRSR